MEDEQSNLQYVNTKEENCEKHFIVKLLVSTDAEENRTFSDGTEVENPLVGQFCLCPLDGQNIELGYKIMHPTYTDDTKSTVATTEVVVGFDAGANKPIYRNQAIVEIKYKEDGRVINCYKMRLDEEKNPIVKIVVLTTEEGVETVKKGTDFEGCGEFVLKTLKLEETDEAETLAITHLTAPDDEDNRLTKFVVDFYEDGALIYKGEEPEPIDWDEVARDEEQAARIAELTEIEANDPVLERAASLEAAFQAEQEEINRQTMESFMTPARKRRYLIMKDNNVVRGVCDIWDMFKKSFHARVLLSDFKFFMSMAYKCIIPNATTKDLQCLVDEHIYINLDENATEINFTAIAYILLDFCDIVLEGSTPSFYATFLTYILEKTSQKWFKNPDGSYTKPPHRVEITFYDNSTVNEAIKRTNSHEPQPTNILYVEETKHYEN